MATSLQRSKQVVQRIIAIPLTRSAPPPAPNSRPSSSQQLYGLTYYHFQIHEPPGKRTEAEQSQWSVSRAAKWAQQKATDTWAGFGKAPESSWKFKIFRAGEKLVDRIDFEELALKGVDPSLGPKIMRWRGKEKDSKPEIPLLYPPSVQNRDIALANLRFVVNQRTPRHKKGFWTWLIISPLTAPFMLIPIIPNLPFFYCAWRSWSHYRAYKASEYLASLIENGAIIPQPSVELDHFYQSDSSKESEDVSKAEEDTPLLKDSSHGLLLSRDVVPSLVAGVGLKAAAEADLYRALEQAKTRIAQT